MLFLGLKLAHAGLLLLPQVVRLIRGKTNAGVSRVPVRTVVRAPGSASGRWQPFTAAGASPSPSGSPPGTVLALHGYNLWTPDVFDAFFALCKQVNVSADALFCLLRHESNLDPTAWNGQAAGLAQITPDTGLSQYKTLAACKGIILLTAVEQLQGPIRQWLLQAGSKVSGMTPGDLLLFNFTPTFLGKPESTVIYRQGDANYTTNAATFDAAQKGFFTVGDVYQKAASILAEANGQRVDRNGNLSSAAAPAGKAAASGTASAASPASAKGRGKGGAAATGAKPTTSSNAAQPSAMTNALMPSAGPVGGAAPAAASTKAAGATGAAGAGKGGGKHGKGGGASSTTGASSASGTTAAPIDYTTLPGGSNYNGDAVNTDLTAPDGTPIDASSLPGGSNYNGDAVNTDADSDTAQGTIQPGTAGSKLFASGQPNAGNGSDTSDDGSDTSDDGSQGPGAQYKAGPGPNGSGTPSDDGDDGGDDDSGGLDDDGRAQAGAAGAARSRGAMDATSDTGDTSDTSDTGDTSDTSDTSNTSTEPATSSDTLDSGGPDLDPNADTRGILLAAVQSGIYDPPDWRWVTVPSLGIDVLVMCDALKCTLGSTPSVRVPVSWSDARQICAALGCILPTPDMINAICAAADFAPKPVGLVQMAADSARMNTVDFVLRYHEQLEAQLEAWESSQGTPATPPLFEPVGKWWCFDQATMQRHVPQFGDHVTCLYGFFQGGCGNPIQPISGVHDDNHSDYSMVFRAVSISARTTGTQSPVNLPDLLASKMPGIAANIQAFTTG